MNQPSSRSAFFARPDSHHAGEAFLFILIPDL
jgi:hypothetical protein